MWIFEPHVAEQVFEDLVTRAPDPRRPRRVARPRQGRQEGRRPHRVDHDAQRQDLRRQDVHRRHLRGRPDGRGRRRLPRRPRGQQRRTARSGTACRPACCTTGHHFGVKMNISPYVVPGDPKSGVLPRISDRAARRVRRGRQEGAGLLLPHVPHRPRPTTASRSPSPTATTPSNTNCSLRVYAAGWRETFDEVRSDPEPQDRHQQPRPVQHRQHRHELRLPRRQLRAPPGDPQGARELPEGLALLHRQRPARARRTCRTKMQTWGLPKDEFTDNGNWPHQLYVREARRMIGDYVMTENELTEEARRRRTRSAWARYSIDSHNVQRYITPEGYVQNEGDIGVGTQGPVRDRLRLARARSRARPTTCSCRSASPARTSPSARSAWSRCS